MEPSQRARRILLKALRSTFQGLQESQDLSPDDPVLLEIKSSILRHIAHRAAESAVTAETEAEEETAA